MATVEETTIADQKAAEEVPAMSHLQGPLLITAVVDEFCEDD